VGTRWTGWGRRRVDAGASLVEFALIVPVFLMLLFGMITGGLALNEKQQMTHATREGARYAATVPANQSFAPPITGWADAVETVLRERSVNSLGAAEDVCVSLVEGSFGSSTNPLVVIKTNRSDGSACLPEQTYPATPNDAGRRVQVWATKDAEIDLVLFGTIDLDLYAEATARSETTS
jgi:hypothetical protein